MAKICSSPGMQWGTRIIGAFCLLLTVLATEAQNGVSVGKLYEKNGSSIELYIRSPKGNPCAQGAKATIYSLYMVNPSIIKDNEGRFLNWKMEVVSCEGERLEKTISVDLERHNEVEFNESSDWRFSVSSITRAFYEVSIASVPDRGKDRFLGKAQSTPPESINGRNEIMSGEEVELSVIGGELIKGADWVWYADGCGQKKIGMGSKVKVSPGGTTKYFVRGESDFSKTDCVMYEVRVNDNSTIATGIKNPGVICRDNKLPVILSVEGGKLGRNAEWVWYQENCPGFAGVTAKKIGTGNSLSVIPAGPTRYFVRAEGAANVTECVFTDLLFTNPPVAPKAIDVSNKNICEGNLLQLTARGGNLGNGGQWVWSSQPINGSKTYLAEGETIQDFPHQNTQYFLKGTNACGSTAEVSITAKVKENSAAASFVDQLKTKQYYKFHLKVNGGKLGEKARWVWYDQASGTKLGIGEELKLKTKKPKAVYVRAEGECDTTLNTSASLMPNKKAAQFKKYKYLFLNVGAGFNDEFELLSGIVTVGSRKIYLSAKIPMSVLGVGDAVTASGYEVNGTGIDNYPQNAGSYYVFNGKHSSKRSGYTLGYIMGGDVFRFAIGAGYGSNEILWEAETYNTQNQKQENIWAKNTAYSVAGPEAELKVFLKLKSFNIIGGVSTIYSLESEGKYVDGHIGIGFSFNTK